MLPIRPRPALHRRPSAVFPVPKIKPGRGDRASVSSIPKIIQVHKLYISPQRFSSKTVTHDPFFQLSPIKPPLQSVRKVVKVQERNKETREQSANKKAKKLTRRKNNEEEKKSAICAIL